MSEPARSIRVLPSAQAVAEAAAEYFVAALTLSMLWRKRPSVALAGGSTPEALYRRLAMPATWKDLDWSLLEVFFGDERCVPPDSPDSNYAKAREALLDHVPVRPEAVYPMRGDLGPDEGARRYEDELRAFFGSADTFPRFNLILLGMGDDGHTASLFPGMSALDEETRWAVGTEVPGYVKPNVPRVTLTLPVLNAAHRVLFLVTGEGKAERVREVFAQDSALPAARVRPWDAGVLWLLDEDAASELPGR